MKWLSFLLTMLIGCIQVYSQSLRFQKAEAYYAVREFKHALEYYEICPAKDSVKLNKVAYCQMMIGNTKQAEENYRTYLTKHSTIDSNYYHFALVLKRNGNYQEAKKYFAQLNSSYPSDKHFSDQMLSCDSASSWLQRETKFSIENIEKINSEYSDVTSVLYKEGLVFSSNREEVFIKKKSEINEEPYYNLLISKLDTSSFRFSYPKMFSSIINSSEHELAPTFSQDGSMIFFTNCKENTKIESNYSRKLKLYASQQSTSDWEVPHTFIFNDSSCSYGHPCMSADGKMFFFASNMAGGQGGVDLYVCLKIENAWTDPINLGPGVNTAGDELFPFYHATSGKLYFASNYHVGLGGFDLFEASDIEGEWGAVRNLGFPFNTADDDFSLYLNASGEFGFLTSNRTGGLGKEDIYLVKRK